MSTVIIKINERSKAGKMLRDLLELISDKPGIEILQKDISSEKNEVLENIKAGLEEVKLFNKGKLKTSSAKDFLNEL
jgi:hypothetical protein